MSHDNALSNIQRYYFIHRAVGLNPLCLALKQVRHDLSEIIRFTQERLTLIVDLTAVSVSIL